MKQNTPSAEENAQKDDDIREKLFSEKDKYKLHTSGQKSTTDKFKT